MVNGDHSRAHPREVLEDERLSTDEAEAFLSQTGLRPRERKKLRDSVAAAVILRSVLERQG